MKKILICSSILLVLASCSSDEATRFPKPSFKGSPSAISLANKTWERFLNHCNGISTYQEGLQFEGIGDFLFLQGELSKINLEFKVTDKMPNTSVTRNAQGHKCFYSILSNGNTLNISKNGCVDICLDKANNSSDYQTSF
jgi:hypothetical protein